MLRKIVDTTKRPSDPNLRDLLDRIARGEERIRVGGLEGSARAFLAALLFHHLHRPLIMVVPDEKEAGARFRDLGFFFDDGEALLLPSWDLLTTDMFAFQRETELARLDVLHRLLYGDPAVVVVSGRALMQKSHRGRLSRGTRNGSPSGIPGSGTTLPES